MEVNKNHAKFEAYWDGCCEPKNPGGNMGVGAYIMRDGKEIFSYSEHYPPGPENSNNVAEYMGFIVLLEKFIEKGCQRQVIEFYGDSNLVVMQITGQWRIKGGRYAIYALKARELFKQFPNAIVRWIPRDQNDRADELSKQHLIKAGVEFKIQPNSNRKLYVDFSEQGSYLSLKDFGGMKKFENLVDNVIDATQKTGDVIWIDRPGHSSAIESFEIIERKPGLLRLKHTGGIT